MANTGITSALQKELWQKEVIIEAIEELFVKQFMSGGVKSPITLKADFQKEAGNKITIPFVPKLVGEGRDGDDELEGSEEEMLQYSNELFIDQKRNAVRLKGRMDEQKSAINLRKTAKEVVSIWLSEIMEKEFFRKAGGLTAYTFSNTPTAPSATRVIYGGDATSDSDIDSSDVMNLSLLFRISNNIKEMTPLLKPIKYKGKDYFVVIIHPRQRFTLMKDSRYLTFMQDAERRGSENPLISGADAVVDNLIIHVHNYVPTFSNWGSGSKFPGARAILMGAQGLALGIGKGSGWVEKGFDFDNKWAIATGRVFGIQKMKFNSIDHGIIAIDTYAASTYAGSIA